MGVGVMLVNVYQHNMFVKVTYQLQHVLHKKQLLAKQKSKLLLRYYQQRNAEALYTWAVNERGMQISTLDHVVSMTRQI